MQQTSPSNVSTAPFLPGRGCGPLAGYASPPDALEQCQGLDSRDASPRSSAFPLQHPSSAARPRPVRLYADDDEPCVRWLHVQCHNQVGLLFKLCELLGNHGVDIINAKVTSEDGMFLNVFELQTARLSDLDDAVDWCKELEDFLQRSSYITAGELGTVASVSRKLSVNPDLLSVVAFSEVTEPGAPPDLHRYKLSVEGINQAGLLTYAFFVIYHCGFHVDSANISTVDGHVSDEFCLSARSYEAEQLLRSHLDLPVRMEPKDSYSFTLPYHATRSDLDLVAMERDSTFNACVGDWAHPSPLDNGWTPHGGCSGSPPPPHPPPRLLARPLPHSWVPPFLSPFAAVPAPQGSNRRRRSPSPPTKEAGMVQGIQVSPSDSEEPHSPVGEGVPSRSRMAAASAPKPRKMCVRFENGDTYAGNCSFFHTGDKRHGHGLYTYSAGQSAYRQYRGQWREDTKHGYGVLFYRNGGVYVGQWEANQRSGLGLLLDVGESASGSEQGVANMTMPTFRYEGQWSEDEPHGLGAEESELSSYYGQFSRGKWHGRGVVLKFSRSGCIGCEAISDGARTPLLDALEAEMAQLNGFPATWPLAEDVASSVELAPDELEAHDTPTKASSSSGIECMSHGCLLSPPHSDYSGRPLSAGGGRRRMTRRLSRGNSSQPDLFGGIDRHSGGGGSSSSSYGTHSARRCGSSSSSGGESSRLPKTAFRRRADSEAAQNLPVVFALSEVNDLITPTDDSIQELIASAAAADTPPFSAAKTVSAPPADPETLACPSRRISAASSAAPPDRSASASDGHANSGASRSEPQVKRSLPPKVQDHPRPRQRRPMRSPMLWCEDELAAFMACLGFGPEVCQQTLRCRIKGARMFMELSNAEMRRECGLTARVDRLTVRQALKRLLDADRWENSLRGRKVADILSDSVMRKFIVPLEELTLVAKISQGGYGTVYRGVLQPKVDRGTLLAGKSHSVAVKEMKGDRRVRLYELLKEACVMASLHHPNICTFLGVCCDTDSATAASSSRKDYIMSELMDCSLFDLIHQPKKVRWHGELSVSMVVSISKGIVNGLVYLHGTSLVHADLKSSNILVDFSGSGPLVPRICDFGHAAVRSFPAPHHRCGTPHWGAPEVLRGEALGVAADVYSLGVIMWEMLAKELPHRGLSFGQALAAVGWAGWIPDLELLPQVPFELTRLIKVCLSFTPSERPASKDVLRRLRRVPRNAWLKALRMLDRFLEG